MIITPRYLFPPRPEKAPVPRTSLGRYRDLGWSCQIKYNDQHTMFLVSPGQDGEDPEIKIYSRHGELRKNYELSSSQKSDILTLVDRLGLDRTKWHYLDGGILHNKSKTFSDIIVIWDILVANGDWLLGSTYNDRYNRLLTASDQTPWTKKIGAKEFDLGCRVGDQLLIPKLYEDYDEAWSLVESVNSEAGWNGKGHGEPALEGVVVKLPSAKLGLAPNDTKPCGWMTRSRVCTGRHRY